VLYCKSFLCLFKRQSMYLTSWILFIG
jgi:hypothetical protein